MHTLLHTNLCFSVIYTDVVSKTADTGYVTWLKYRPSSSTDLDLDELANKVETYMKDVIQFYQIGWVGNRRRRLRFEQKLVPDVIFVLCWEQGSGNDDEDVNGGSGGGGSGINNNNDSNNGSSSDNGDNDSDGSSGSGDNKW
ncbi:Lon protease 2 [Spatholobus suberectus]|nr:Lon protease 2 [Spatholobus suberectus]